MAEGLRDAHSLRLTDRTAVDTDLEFVRCELGHDESTDLLVAGIDAIVHLAAQPLVSASRRDPWGTLETNIRMQLKGGIPGYEWVACRPEWRKP